ncbi:DoxX family protein [Caulobacter segnis]|uniref:DoxX family protein n=1 Tax=Caulobacter segnis (strain ATCC 21756 / DSM 7131 / JCM 7823 / NBRC 15250 / LMG 17158 / TK0059) TaxID=509190 RepID=D5VJN9_CAUST|nr:DoxX family protein [Caulobacter segnis]ADG10568.1 DoxX family protein [Caulobacter segnis ATCC 21756]
MTTPAPIAGLLRSSAFGVFARAVLTLPYWWSGIAKLTNLKGALAEASGLGLKPAALIVAATIAVQLGGSLALILGRIGWLAAGALGVFTALATLIAHPYWTVVDPTERFHALNTFLEHIGLIGGFMLAAILVEKERAA